LRQHRSEVVMSQNGFYMDIAEQRQADDFYQPMLENRRFNAPTDLDRLSLEHQEQHSTADKHVLQDKRFAAHNEPIESLISATPKDRVISALTNDIEQMKKRLLNVRRQERKLMKQLLTQNSRVERRDIQINDLIEKNYKLQVQRNILAFQVENFKEENEKLKQELLIADRRKSASKLVARDRPSVENKNVTSEDTDENNERHEGDWYAIKDMLPDSNGFYQVSDGSEVRKAYYSKKKQGFFISGETIQVHIWRELNEIKQVS